MLLILRCVTCDARAVPDLIKVAGAVSDNIIDKERPIGFADLFVIFLERKLLGCHNVIYHHLINTQNIHH